MFRNIKAKNLLSLLILFRISYAAQLPNSAIFRLNNSVLQAKFGVSETKNSHNTAFQEASARCLNRFKQLDLHADSSSQSVSNEIAKGAVINISAANQAEINVFFTRHVSSMAEQPLSTVAEINKDLQQQREFLRQESFQKSYDQTLVAVNALKISEIDKCIAYNTELIKHYVAEHTALENAYRSKSEGLISYTHTEQEFKSLSEYTSKLEMQCGLLNELLYVKERIDEIDCIWFKNSYQKKELKNLCKQQSELIKHVELRFDKNLSEYLLKNMEEFRSKAGLVLSQIQKAIPSCQNEVNRLKSLIDYAKACQDKFCKEENAKFNLFYKKINDVDFLGKIGSLKCEDSASITPELTIEGQAFLEFSGIALEEYRSMINNAFQKELAQELGCIVNYCGKRFTEFNNQSKDEIIQKVQYNQGQSEAAELITHQYVLSPEAIAVIKDYDQKLLESNSTLTATAEQHSLYQQNFDILDSIGIVEGLNYKDLKNTYLDSAKKFSFAALEQTQKNNLELASTCTEVAKSLLYTTCSHIKDAVVTDILIAKGVIRGTANAIISTVSDTVNSILHPMRTCEGIASLINHITLSNEPLDIFIEAFERNTKGKPLEDQVAYVTQMIVSFIAPAKCMTVFDKALVALSSTIEAELLITQNLIKAGQELNVATHAPVIAEVLKEFESINEVVKACCKYQHVPRQVNVEVLEKIIKKSSSELTIQETLQLPCPTITKEVLKHIISGDINLRRQKVSGLHHGHKHPQLFLKEYAPDIRGVYKIRWAKGDLKGKSSSCVPKNMNMVDHVEAIIQAYYNPVEPTILLESGGFKVIGESKSNIPFEIVAVIGNNNEIIIKTAYPLYNYFRKL